jgi:exosortase
MTRRLLRKSRGTLVGHSTIPTSKRATSRLRETDDIATELQLSIQTRRPPWEISAVCAVLSAVFLWANWEWLGELIATWNREPDYSHGYLVGPVAALILWTRRDRFPTDGKSPGWGGFALLAVSLVLGFAGRQYFLNPLVYWAMIVWIGGVAWVLGGRRVFLWALPAIAFLIFMVPLPFRMESWLSGPLQRIATILSCWSLQVLGQPAFAEGNTIFLGMTQIEVEQACSGLRMLVMITALASACAILVCRNWPERLFLLLCIVPVSLFSNGVRIVATGLAYQYLSTEASKAIMHDIAGWIVVPVAAGTLALALLYWRRLFVQYEQAVLPVSHHPVVLQHGIKPSTNAS